MNKFHTDPTGMPGDATKRFFAMLAYHEMEFLTAVDSPYGKIFIGERWNPLLKLSPGGDVLTGGYDVVWGSRGHWGELEAYWNSTQQNRVMASIEDAYRFISKLDQRH